MIIILGLIILVAAEQPADREGEAGRLGMGPAVVPGQDRLGYRTRQATGRWQIWQRATGRWVTVTGKRREAGLLIRSGDARPVAVTLPCAARTPHGTQEGSWPAVRVNSG